MNSIVFRGRHDFEIFGVSTLQTTDEGGPDLTGKERVFAVSLLPATPTRIANDVDVWRPESEAVVNRMVFVSYRTVVFGSRFGGDRIPNTSNKRCIPGSCEADRLREDSGISRTCDTVESLVPPVILRDVKTRNRGRLVLHLRYLFREGHAANEVVDTHSQWQIQAKVWINLLRPLSQHWER